MDVDEPQSLILVVSHKIPHLPHHSSIIRIETPHFTQVYDDDDDDDDDDDASSAPPPPLVQLQTGFSAHVPHFPEFDPWIVHWEFSGPPASSPEDLYILPDWAQPDWQPYNAGSLPGIIFNFSTKKCKLIKPPQVPKCPMGYVVTMGDHIYFMAQHNSIYHPRFERYDTLSRSWEELDPFHAHQPYKNLRRVGDFIAASAVLDDTILLHMNSGNMLAYNATRNKWYTVKVSNHLCSNIVGEAVVVNNIIYALTSSCQSLLTLTLRKSCQENDGEEDLVYTCDLLKEYVVPVIGEVKFELQNVHFWSMHLVHLGKDNFCVVRTCAQKPFEYRPFKSQYIQLAYIVVSEKKLIVTNICVHEFKIFAEDDLGIIRCFSMPTCKSNALKEDTQLIFPEYEAEDKDDVEVVTLPPELPQIVEKYSFQRNTIAEQDFEQGGSVHADTNKSSASVVSAPSKATTIPATKASTLGDVAASGRSNTDEEGHSICVRNLPLDFSLGELENELKKFGSIKSFKIRLDYHMRDCWVADVEFESWASKQNAIKTRSSLRIEGRFVVIEEKGIGLGVVL